jgi:hypothetical protein
MLVSALTVLQLDYVFSGVLFTNWIADSLTLWKNPVTDEHLWTSARYYSILASLPEKMTWALGTVVLVCGAVLGMSLARGEAGNLMFDGGSIRESCHAYQWNAVRLNALAPF